MTTFGSLQMYAKWVRIGVNIRFSLMWTGAGLYTVADNGGTFAIWPATTILDRQAFWVDNPDALGF